MDLKINWNTDYQDPCQCEMCQESNRKMVTAIMEEIDRQILREALILSANDPNITNEDREKIQKALYRLKNGENLDD